MVKKSAAPEISAGARQTIIRELIKSKQLSSHIEIVETLAKSGILVTQATVSRDLDHLGAVRVRGVNGNLVYQLQENHSAEVNSREVGLLSIKVSGNIVLLTTRPGAASLVASKIDRSIAKGESATLLGTVAGDDTVMVLILEDAKSAAVKEIDKLFIGAADLYQALRQSGKGKGR
jgi:transcriptional regulator of arginine metabolism